VIEREKYMKGEYIGFELVDEAKLNETPENLKRKWRYVQ